MNHFISFADSRMTDSLNRLCRQAEALEFFDEITSFTESTIFSRNSPAAWENT